MTKNTVDGGLWGCWVSAGGRAQGASWWKLPCLCDTQARPGSSVRSTVVESAHGARNPTGACKRRSRPGHVQAGLAMWTCSLVLMKFSLSPGLVSR